MEGAPTQPTTPESNNRELEPKIYVASLSDYNDGRLHGDWIDAAQFPTDIHDDIDSMLQRSPMAHAEEFAIHDYEDFGAFRIGEYEDINLVAMIANGIVEHGHAFSHWANHVGTLDDDRLHRFEDHYRGAWESLSKYAKDLVDDMGATPESFTPGWLLPYVSIDYLALGNDLASDLEISKDADGTVHIFEADL